MKQQTSQILTNSFLNEFTAELMLNYGKIFLKEKEKKVEKKEKVEKIISASSIPLPSPLPSAFRVMPRIPSLPVTLAPRMPMPGMPAYAPSLISQPPLVGKIEELKTGKPTAPTGNINLGKLNQLLADPSISKLECQGENQPILITRLGQTTMTKITLNADEINKILEEFSRETRIPIIKGVFRALFENLMISAVVSDFVKPKFIITKLPLRQSAFR